MKKIINIILVVSVLFSFTNCEDDKEHFEKTSPIVTLDVKSISSVNFNDQVTISGSVSSPNYVRDISFYLVKKTGEGYERLWFSALQFANIKIEKTVDFNAQVAVDDPDADAIAVSVTDPYGQNTIDYVAIEAIEGAPSGSAFVQKNIEMTAEYEYGMSAPYIFSLTGVNINGTIKHIVSLNEVDQTGARNLDFAFVNVWRNTTTFTSGVLGNWGYAFCEARQLARGPVGRQCDYISLTGSSSIPAGMDTCSLVLVPAAVASINNFDQVMENAGDNFGTSNFLNQLATLFKADVSQYVVNMKTAASGVNTTKCVENANDGSYIAFRKMKNKIPYYGLIKIEKLPDVTDALLDGGDGKYKTEPYDNGEVGNLNLPKMWYNGPDVKTEGIAQLFGKSIVVSIISQK